MKRPTEKKKIGILGCGAIGSGMAKSVVNDLHSLCELTALHDRDQTKASLLAQTLSLPRVVKYSYDDLLAHCDLVVEAVNDENAHELIAKALNAQKDIIVMSIGKVFAHPEILELAARKGCALLLPSGAIAGIDAVKAASLVNISSIVLTTRKPTTGFMNDSYLLKQKIDVSKITGEKVIFEGPVDKAIKAFPRNINVAATLALASRAKEKITVRIITSPNYKSNCHEIEILGDFGRIMTRTENAICPDNPKTSYLAVLSGIQTLKDFCGFVKIGT